MKLEDWIMPFGKHKGLSLEDVPASYLLWLADQESPPDAVAEYVKMNRHALEDEVEVIYEGREDFRPEN